MIPLYLIFKKLNWLNTFKPLIVPDFFANPLHVFLLRQFFMTIPLEMDDAAKIDGCGFFDIYRRILLPLAKPALGVIAMFTFTSRWNEFTRPLLYLNTLEKMTISMGLRSFQTELGIEKIQELMAVSVMSVVPILVLFFVGQKYFVRGITMTGMK
jgi:multiple sugar transport system permease protein